MSEVTEFPKSIEGFGYKFNEKGELRNIDTNERFLFYVKPQDRSYNQEHYEALGEVIGEYIENELVKKYNLVRQIIPVETKDDDNVAKSRIYQSDDAQECQTLLLLIQGSGVVRPGQWARQVVINDSLELGTMFPYIRKAQNLKWGIIIFNPNENYQSITKDGEIVYRRISGSESPQDHCLYVWDKFVKNAKAERILIVAHSYGGICTTYMLDSFDEFKSRVKGIALTDSVHSSGMIPAHSRKWFRDNTINWIKSPLPLNKQIPEAKQYYGCFCFSAGHTKHEYTSGMAIETVFEFLQGQAEKKHRKEVTNKENETDKQSSDANNEDTTARESTATEVVDEPFKAAIDTQAQETSSSLPLEKDTTVIEKSQLDSTMEIADESPISTQTQETSSVPVEPQLDSAMETTDESQINTQTQETSSVPFEPQLDSAMEIADEPQINTQIQETSSVPVEPQLDSAMEITDESQINMKTQEISSVPVEPWLDSAMETTDESQINTQTQETSSVPVEPQLDSAMEITDESQINMQTQEISSVPFEPQLDSAMEIADESALGSAMEVVDKSPQNIVPCEKDTTEKLQQIAEMKVTEPKIIGQQESFVNDNEPQREKVVVSSTILVENNTSENQVITEGVPKEIETCSTSIQQTKDDNISKESSQDNNLQKADNLSTSDNMNNFKGNEENINM